MVCELYLTKSVKKKKDRKPAMRAPSSKILSLFRDTADTLVFKASSGSCGLKASLLRLAMLLVTYLLPSLSQVSNVNLS